ncbi:MAG: vitamin K epoxide reductase family protein [Cyanobacteria bacterium P01_A01_bin.123]
MARRRRQEKRWIHHWSRPLIAAIAAVGGLGTTYLTVVKFMGGSAACPTSGCDRVLSSPYAQLFGIPLTLFGALAYLSMVVLAVAPLLIDANTRKELHQKIEGLTWPLLFIGATGMVVFSGYLMYLLAFEIQAACLYCLTSAAFTVLMFGLTLLGNRWEDSGQLMFTGFIVAAVALTGTVGLYATVIDAPAEATAAADGQTGLPNTNTSGPSELALAQHLQDIGAKKYGAWWCPHCHDQKMLFGKEAFDLVPYIECDPEGANSQTELCQSIEEIRGFPTWEVNGEFYGGTRTLEELADLSGYTGPREFKN